MGEETEMIKNFYVFRHGETELNREKRWQGSGMNYDLTAEGVRQAAGLAEKLSDRGIEIIYSSPLIRARHTAEVVAEKLNVGVDVKEDLRECFYGTAEGRKISELQEEVPEIVNNWQKPGNLDLRFPGGESKGEALERVLMVLRGLETEGFRTAGVAIHGGTMAALLGFVGVKFDVIPNCGAFLLKMESGQFRAEGSVF